MSAHPFERAPNRAYAPPMPTPRPNLDAEPIAPAIPPRAQLESAGPVLLKARLPFFPVGHDKSPYLKWTEADMPTAETLWTWQSRFPVALAAVPMGTKSGLFAVDLDIDRETGEPTGENSFRALGLDLSAQRFAARTPSGGWHVFYRWREGLPGNLVKPIPGIDLRSDGGYVVAWAPETLAAAAQAPDLPEPPPALLQALQRRERAAEATPANPPRDADAWAEAALAEECGALRAAPKGGRNNALNRAAFSLGQIVGGGRLDRARVESELWAAAMANGLAAEEPKESRATINSGLNAGMADPRGPKPSDGPTPALAQAAPAVAGPADPVPLVAEMQPGEPYPLEALGPLRAAAEAIQDKTQAPAAIAAHSVLGVAALCVQGFANVQTLGGDAPASLFILSIAQSGERKSGCDRLAMKGVREMQKEWGETWRDEERAWRNRHAIWDTQRKTILKAANEDATSAAVDLDALGDEPEAPLHPLIVAQDPTLEGFTRHLPRLRPALGLFSDEGGGFIGGHGMNRDNRTKTIAGLSDFWDGDPVDRWRAGDGVDSYPGRRLSLHLMVQPVVAAQLLDDPLAQGQGFLARCLITEPPSTMGARIRLGYDPASDAALAAFCARVKSLLRHPLPLAEGRRNELEPPCLALSSEALQVLEDFYLAVEPATRADAELGGIQAFANKAPEHAARMAAVMTLFANPDAEEVSGETMADAVRLAGYYLREAVRLSQQAAVSRKTTEAHRLLSFLHGKWDEDFVSLTEMVQYGPFRETGKTRPLAKLLEQHGWLEPQKTPVIIRGKQRRTSWRIVREGR